MKKIILIIVGVLIVAGLAGGGYYFWQKKKNDLEKQNIQKQQQQKAKEQKPVVQMPTGPLFATKEIPFEERTLENFDKTDPYYDLIINNANKRFGNISEIYGIKTQSETNETGIENYAISSDGYIFVSYSMWVGTRLAKIEIASKKIIDEYYFKRHCDTVCPNSAGLPKCYNGGDKNKLIFYNNSNNVTGKEYYQSWDLNKKDVQGIDLASLDIKNEQDLINSCKGIANTKATTSQPSFDSSQILPKSAVVNKTIDIDFKNDGVAEKVLAYTLPNGAVWYDGSTSDKYYVDVYEHDGVKWNLIKQDQGTKGMINIQFDKVQKVVWDNIDNQEYLAISKDMAGNDPSYSTYLYFYDKNKGSYSEAYPDKIAEPKINSLTSGVTENMQLRGFGFNKTDDGFIYGNGRFKVYFKYAGNGVFNFIKNVILDAYGKQIN